MLQGIPNPPFEQPDASAFRSQRLLRAMFRIPHILIICASCIFFLCAGCSHLHSHTTGEFVYVSTRQPIYLRDRVAAVSTHTGQVANGQRRQGLEHGHRFIKVQDELGAIGWIEDTAVLTQAGYDQFLALAAQHAHDPVINHVILRDDMFMHLAPGVKTEHFYLLPANTKLEVLARTSIPKGGAQQPAAASEAQPGAKKSTRHKGGNKKAEAETASTPMEDWWLARDKAGHTGWMLARLLDVDVPDDIAQYSEGQRMVGAYILTTVHDPDSGKPNGEVPEYVTVLTPYKDGLPFDFDQVRVFTWDTKHHRYGTAFREHDIAGRFPVTVTQQDFGSGPVPVFTIQAEVKAPASKAGETPAGSAPMQTITYRLDGNLIRRVVPAGEKSAPALHHTQHRKRR